MSRLCSNIYFVTLSRADAQTKIHQRATFGWKMSPRAEVLNMKGSAGRNMEKYAIFGTQIGHI